jgi:hypothetical protein
MECLPATPVSITVSIDSTSTAPAQAMLEGGTSPPLRIVGRDSGEQLWSAGATPPVVQQIETMNAAFAGSFTPLDIDNDGVHDRIYAGDLAGRLWRFDLHHGAGAAHWASASVFADFSNAVGRGFLAPPDVSLATDGERAWLNIAIGTASPGNATANNRYYVLRDYSPFENWTDREHLAWNALREDDLLRIADPREAPDGDLRNGYFIELGGGQVIAPSLTVSGRAVLAVADALPTGASCQVAISIAALDLQHAVVEGTAEADVDGWLRRLPVPIPANTGFALSEVGGTAQCTLGSQHITACDVDTRPVKTWWRRGDAE